MARPKPYGPPLLRHLRNLRALILREILRQSEGRLGYAAVFIEPLAFIVGLSLIRYELHPIPPLGNSMMLFFLQGVVVFYAFNKTENWVSNGMHRNRHILVYPVVAPFDLYVAQFILATANMVVLYHVFLISHNFAIANTWPEQIVWPEDVVRIYEAIVMAGLYGFVMGVFNVSLEQFFPAWERIYGMVRRAQFILSGKMFVVDFMPTEIRNILWWNPLTHCVELSRSAFYTFYESKTMNLTYFYGSLLGFAAVTFSLERLARNRMQVES